MATKEQMDLLNKELVVYAADQAVRERKSIHTIILDQVTPEWQTAQDVDGQFRTSLILTDTNNKTICGFPGSIVIDQENHTVKFIAQIQNATVDVMNNLFNTLFTLGDNWRKPEAEEGRTWQAGKDENETFTTLTFSRIFLADHQMRAPSLEVSEYAAALGVISGGRLSLSTAK